MRRGAGTAEVVSTQVIPTSLNALRDASDSSTKFSQNRAQMMDFMLKW